MLIDEIFRWSKNLLVGRCDPENTKDNSKFAEAPQEAKNGLSRQRKGKFSKSSKLSEIGIIAKSVSQAFQRRKWLIKQSYGSKYICGQSFGQTSPVSRDESTSVLLTSASVLHIIFIIPMIVNDVNLSVAFRGVSGLSS
jgi:hypothetical protein